MTETRIRWEPTGSGSFAGHVGTLESWMFYIHRPVLAGQRWMLSATLPGALDDVRPGSPDELKAEAERWLEEFVSSLGAVFPEATEHVRQPLRMVGRQAQLRLCSCGEPWPCNGARNWHYGWAKDSRDGDGNLILRYEPTGGLYRVLPIEET